MVVVLVVALALIGLGFFAVLNRRSFKLTANLLKVLHLSVEIDKPDKPELPPGGNKP